jgi:hypothetical protein
MNSGQRIEKAVTFVEYWGTDGEITVVSVSVVGAAIDKTVTGFDVITEKLFQNSDLISCRTRMGRTGNSHRYRTAVIVNDGTREVSPGVYDSRTCRSEHRVGHVSGNEVKPLGQNCHQKGLNTWLFHNVVPLLLVFLDRELAQ